MTRLRPFRGVGLFGLSLALLVAPGVAPAGTVLIQAEAFTQSGVAYSFLHTASGCSQDGFYMCGGTPQTIGGALTADLVEGSGGNFTLRNIQGDLGIQAG